MKTTSASFYVLSCWAHEKLYKNQILPEKFQEEIDCHCFKFHFKGRNHIKCTLIYFDEVKQGINKSDLFKARCIL